MNKEKRLQATGSYSSQAFQASMKLTDIIVEKYLAGLLPEPRQIPIKEVNESTIYNYSKLRKYLNNDRLQIKGQYINITADEKFLFEQAQFHAKRKILKLVIASKFDIHSFENVVGKFTMDIEFTEEERGFIDLMFNEIMSITQITKFPRKLELDDMCNFNWVNRDTFYCAAKRIYNDILQKKLHAGDNIIAYLRETDLSIIDIYERVKNAEKYDYFFDKRGILKCDLKTNKDILIKNFINSVLFSLDDPKSRAALLLKLNAKYPFLISEKVFEEFN